MGREWFGFFPLRFTVWARPIVCVTSSSYYLFCAYITSSFANIMRLVLFVDKIHCPWTFLFRFTKTYIILYNGDTGSLQRTTLLAILLTAFHKKKSIAYRGVRCWTWMRNWCCTPKWNKKHTNASKHNGILDRYYKLADYIVYKISKSDAIGKSHVVQKAC